MYLWKCWLEYRKIALPLIVLALCFTLWGDYLIVSVPSVRVIPSKGAVIMKPGLERFRLPEQKDDALKGIESVHGVWLILVGLFAACCVGAVGGTAREFDNKTTELLLTRPVRRRTLLWKNWLSGMVAIEAVALVPLFTWILFSVAVVHSVGNLHLLQTLLQTLPLNMVVFGVSFAIGILLRSAPMGTLATIGIILAYLVTVSLSYARYSLQTPSWWFDKLYEGFPYGQAPIPWTIFLLWSAIALFFPFAAQKILEYRDVV